MLYVFPAKERVGFVLLTAVLSLHACAFGVEPSEPSVAATVYQPDGQGGASSSVWASGQLTRVGRDYLLDDMLFPEWLVEELRESDTPIAAIEQPLAAWTEPRWLWPNATVPYVIEPGMPDMQRITDAIAEWHAKTPIRLVPRTSEAAYVTFFARSAGCTAHVGHVGGAQAINLGPECHAGAVVHEIGHAIGLWHEHTRADRNNHIQVLYENVAPEHHSIFDIVQSATPLGPYDTESIMHYYSKAFSKNGKPTLLRLDGSEIRSRSTPTLSALDAQHATVLYGGFNGRFADDDGNIHESGIEKIAAAGITVGCSQGYPPRYCPSDAVTRAQMAVFLNRAIGLTVASVDAFDDDNGTWYEAAANSIAAAGITVGCGERRYCPNDTVTRGQMAAFLSRALNLPATNVDYFDDDNGKWYEGVANRMYEAGVTKGCGTRKYCGDEPVLRDQMASFLARAFL